MSTYKRPAQLKAQLEGIISQEYKNIEIIVSDNDPDGSGREAAESISDSRIKYYANAENLGMVKSFNKSISRSKGDFIVMVTDDDPVYPGMLSILLDFEVASIGGDNGYYFLDALWSLRGTLDRWSGGRGLTRGRRDPRALAVGDAIDFWRVVGLEAGRRLTLLAEMKLPGAATLGFELQPLGERHTRIAVRASFHPAGVKGLLYWHAMAPAHAVIFPGLSRAIAQRAAARASTHDKHQPFVRSRLRAMRAWVRRHRWVCLWLAALMFGGQVAASAYACPTVAADTPVVQGPDCAGRAGGQIDPAQPLLCKAHCEAGQQSVNSGAGTASVSAKREGRQPVHRATGANHGILFEFGPLL